ncbi:hypothetical protein [Pseudomonas brassicacearum]|uniref:hypothetical protein n=1 Tax=Pseudomonas brassicacearum TaxID=930166 RepID=UPI0012963BBA|nr:hypothetical protein [Pseudomonas brassicacearum]QGA47661.1 hypothetical protein GFU70_00550 [Pseudomonas brassicacearum]
MTMAELLQKILESIPAEVAKGLVGVAIAVLAWVWLRLQTTLLDYRGRGLKGLTAQVYVDHAVFNEPQDQVGAASPDSPQPVLRIQIINQTGAPVFLAAAAFRPRVRRFFFFSRAGASVASNFKSGLFKKSLQIKFGTDNKTTYTLLDPGSRDSTWVRLKIPVSPEMIERSKCGQVLIKFATESKTGTAVVPV